MGRYYSQAVYNRHPLPLRYRRAVVTPLGMAGECEKVLLSRPHGEAAADAPRGLRGPHRFGALADDAAQESPDALGVSRHAPETKPPARQTRVAPVGRRH